MTRRARLLPVACAAALLAGCGNGASAEPVGDGPREWAVAEDPGATASEIVDAGAPVDVAVSDGLRLVTWQVEPDDDEGPHQGAWRLYDADGARLAEGGFGQVTEQGARIDATAVPDGFLLESYAEPDLWHVDRDGTATQVRASREPRATRPGDVLVSDPGGVPRAYRPSGRSAARLPPLPTRNAQSVALDPTGAVSVLLPWGGRGGVRVDTSPDGSAPWSTARLPLPRGGYPVTELRSTQDRVLLLTARPPEPGASDGLVDALWWRAVDGARWTSVPFGGGPLTDWDGAEPGVVDGRLLVGSASKGAWVEDGDGFRPVDLPAAEATVQVEGDELYALDRRGRALHVSDDLGATWSEVER